jgi:hypothetical protein
MKVLASDVVARSPGVAKAAGSGSGSQGERQGQERARRELHRMIFTPPPRTRKEDHFT